MGGGRVGESFLQPEPPQEASKRLTVNVPIFLRTAMEGKTGSVIVVDVIGQDIVTEVVFRIAPDGVDVVALVLNVGDFY